MACCEKCWKEAGGIAARYAELWNSRQCTPEEQAGDNAGTCDVCRRRTIHQYAKCCMNPVCESNAVRKGE